jgi:hypothetical protein
VLALNIVARRRLSKKPKTSGAYDSPDHPEQDAVSAVARKRSPTGSGPIIATPLANGCDQKVASSTTSGLQTLAIPGGTAMWWVKLSLMAKSKEKKNIRTA